MRSVHSHFSTLFFVRHYLLESEGGGPSPGLSLFEVSTSVEFYLTWAACMAEHAAFAADIWLDYRLLDVVPTSPLPKLFVRRWVMGTVIFLCRMGRMVSLLRPSCLREGMLTLSYGRLRHRRPCRLSLCRKGWVLPSPLCLLRAGVLRLRTRPVLLLVSALALRLRLLAPVEPLRPPLQPLLRRLS